MKHFYICMIFLFILFSFSACTNHIPQPTEPSEPTQPEEPSEPTQPEEPSEPTQPEEPSEPTQPEEPSEPTQPEEPSEPTQPTEPSDPYAIHEISADKIIVDGTKKTYKGQNITLSVPVDWLALEQHGEDGTTYFFRDQTSDRCQLTFYSTGSQFAINRTEAEYLALFSRWGYENVNILSCTNEKISGYDCTKVVYSYTVEDTEYIGTRYDNVITGLCMYMFSTVYPAAESERIASVFGSVMDSIVLQPY